MARDNIQLTLFALHVEPMEPPESMPPTDAKGCTSPCMGQMHLSERSAVEASPVPVPYALHFQETAGGADSPATLVEVPLGAKGLRPEVQDRIAKAKARPRAPSTDSNYRRRMTRFAAWCENNGVPALPAPLAMVEGYLTEMAIDGHAMAYIRSTWAAIRHFHLQAGHAEVAQAKDQIGDLIAALARDFGRPQGQAKGLRLEHLAAIEATAFQPRRLGGWGNRHESQDTANRRAQMDIALLRTMRDGMLRRSEAAALTWKNFLMQPSGTGRLHIVRSKTDQASRGVYVYLGLKAVQALEAIRPPVLDPGQRIFDLSGGQICRRIGAAARHAGFGDGYSGHSLRVGMCQDLVRTGRPIHAVMNAGRWGSPRMPARYSQETELEHGAIAQYYAIIGQSPPVWEGIEGVDNPE